MIPLPATRAVLSGRQTYAQKVLTIAPANLLAYWQLKETSGTAIVDSSPNARHGVYTGVDLAQNQPPFVCPLWDGVNDYGNVYSVSLRDAFNGQEGTFACWFKVASAGVWTDATERRIVHLQADGSNLLYIRRTTTNNVLQCTYLVGGVSDLVALTLSPTTWQHIAMTWSKAADQLIGYLNGVQQGAIQTGVGTWAGPLTTTTANLGARNTTPLNSWHGYLAHPAIWNTPLSAAQVLALATP